MGGIRKNRSVGKKIGFFVVLFVTLLGFVSLHAVTPVFATYACGTYSADDYGTDCDDSNNATSTTPTTGNEVTPSTTNSAATSDSVSPSPVTQTAISRNPQANKVSTPIPRAHNPISPLLVIAIIVTLLAIGVGLFILLRHRKHPIQ